MIQAYWYENGTLLRGMPVDFVMSLCSGKQTADTDLSAEIISLVGGGGKTTLMHHLAGEFQKRGLNTAVMTTTRMQKPEKPCMSSGECECSWEFGKYAVCGRQTSDGKFGSPQNELVRWLKKNADILLIEADGAKRMPCKVPAGYEPVILPDTDMVIGVMGIDAYSRPVGEVCFRAELACSLLGCSTDHCLDSDDMAGILLSGQGTKKDTGTRKYMIVLNKCDDAGSLKKAEAVAHRLEEKGHTGIMLTTLK